VRGCTPAAAGGFTLVELLVVLVLIAIAAGTATLALRDGEAVRLEREAARLVALLEAARAEARASGVAVRFELRDGTFGFAGLPARLRPPEGWQAEGLQARIESPGQALTGSGVALQAIALGPEPLIGAQRIVLQLGERQLAVVTDGLAPFSVASGEAGEAGEAAASGNPAAAGTR
jgi:general secretion pathway protein H